MCTVTRSTSAVYDNVDYSYMPELEDIDSNMEDMVLLFYSAILIFSCQHSDALLPNQTDQTNNHHMLVVYYLEATHYKLFSHSATCSYIALPVSPDSYDLL